MYAVYNYPVELKGGQLINLPANAEVLKIDYQPSTNTVCIWALVDTEALVHLRLLRIYGTGHQIEIPSPVSKFIGTFFYKDLVFHAFLEPR